MTRTGSARSPQSTCGHWAVVFVVVILGTVLVRGALAEASGPPQPQPAAALNSQPAPERDASASASPSPAKTVEPLPASTPVRISIPVIGLDAPMTPIGLGEEGFILPPPAQEENLAGWLRSSPTPGESGTAVIAGHVDNDQGPAVFYHLGALKKGHHLKVTREDGATAVFEVYGIEVFETDAFPAQRVYADTGRPELRVLTCGGTYQDGTGYSGNVVVFARLVTTT